jgi:hypothetical protein
VIDRKLLLEDLKKQVKLIEADLGRQLKALSIERDRLHAEYEKARKLGRTGDTRSEWLDGRITQVAVGWVLGTVFVRFCEDNGLIPEPFLAAPGLERMRLAEERYAVYRDSDDDPTYRGWLLNAFEEIGQGQAGKLLFDQRHNPLYQLPISHDGARDLARFWQNRDEAGHLVHDFTDPLSEDGTKGWNTRFLGDLYQDLSETARKAYALLQTPEFVEEFILDRAMNPAVREFGHQELKMIDPTCGSGHFVLGAFRRLVQLWAKKPLGRDLHSRVRAALDSVHGVDINPFAIAIARFRLLLAAMAAAEISTLADANKYEWPMHVAVGDSLIKARQQELGGAVRIGKDGSLELNFGEVRDELAEFSYGTEDIHEHQDILKEGRYHVVAGNPPYITVKDKKLNQLYRELYKSSIREYALSVPFAERFFQLARTGGEDGKGYGYVGQITSNSFMKREFGAKLIEEYFAHKVELTEVIDTSGAFIPGHGTPTVILIGRRRAGKARGQMVRTVRSVQGEPTSPEKAADGLVWNAILELVDQPGSANQWVAVDDLDRARYFAKHPWILTSGGLELVEQIENKKSKNLINVLAMKIGFGGITGDDETFILADTMTSRRKNLEHVIEMVTGSSVRDFSTESTAISIWPYNDQMKPFSESEIPGILASIWPNRRLLQLRKRFGKSIETIPSIKWYEYRELYKDKLKTPLSLTFAEVATHNHFSLSRGARIFNQTAPLIKLREGASENEYRQLLGLLGSSTACFWLKMRCHNKGGQGINEGFKSQEWERFYQFSSTNVQDFPIPNRFPLAVATRIDNLSQELATTTLSGLLQADTTKPLRELLIDAENRWKGNRGRMIALQEELDWQVYSIYGLHAKDLSMPSGASVPELKMGERAFEIALARKVDADKASRVWFDRHGSTPITELPEHWPNEYKDLVAMRIKVIEESLAIGMIERPEYKRRWATEGWDVLQERGLRSWLLDRLEAGELWFELDAVGNEQPQVRTLDALTDLLSRDADFVSVTEIYAPRTELREVISNLLADEHVPFLAALRYKDPSGMRKRADWEYVWEKQREEDAAADEPAKRKIRDTIPVPPKYTSADFLKPSYWRARGKLDVPKERFISYPADAGTPNLFGWAGWNHREQAQALTIRLTDLTLNQAAERKELVPLLAGLLELQPWLDQWHHESDPMYGMAPSAFFAGQRAAMRGEYGMADEELKAWRPERATRRRTSRKQS